MVTNSTVWSARLSKQRCQTPVCGGWHLLRQPNVFVARAKVGRVLHIQCCSGPTGPGYRRRPFSAQLVHRPWVRVTATTTEHPAPGTQCRARGRSEAPCLGRRDRTRWRRPFAHDACAQGALPLPARSNRHTAMKSSTQCTSAVPAAAKMPASTQAEDHNLPSAATNQGSHSDVSQPSSSSVPGVCVSL